MAMRNLMLVACGWAAGLLLSVRGMQLGSSQPSSRGLQLGSSQHSSPGRTFYIETHGCQMNLADSDVVRSVLLSAGYAPSDDLETSDLILTNTCAIRENAEAKIYHRLKFFQSIRKKHRKAHTKPEGYPLIGLLGCMAERLKTQLLEDKAYGIDFIAGPDAYRELPNLLMAASTDQRAANTQLSMDETYADIAPVRLAEGNTHAFVTIQRGCQNHCAFCIVPYTRGRERSRPAESIVTEVRQLRDQGYKEVVLLGQTVNSYRDVGNDEEGGEEREERGRRESQQPSLAEGFTQRWRARGGVSTDFKELLQRVSEVDVEMRVRFQAPHPKDFPDDVLEFIAASPNVCKALHMPAQHGSSTVLDRMQRGYSREAYVSLVHRARALLGRGSPEGVGMGLSSDFIAGFCGETDEEHKESVSLLSDLGFDQAFTYAYSRREQTYAGLFYKDDVDEAVKARRLDELVNVFQTKAMERNTRLEMGRLHVVLVEGEGKRPGTFTGRTDSNKRVVFPWAGLLLLKGIRADEAAALARAKVDDVADMLAALGDARGQGEGGVVEKGVYIVVKVTGARGHTLRGVPLATTTIAESHPLNLPALPVN